MLSYYISASKLDREANETSTDEDWLVYGTHLIIGYSTRVPTHNRSALLPLTTCTRVHVYLIYTHYSTHTNVARVETSV